MITSSSDHYHMIISSYDLINPSGVGEPAGDVILLLAPPPPSPRHIPLHGRPRLSHACVGQHGWCCVESQQWEAFGLPCERAWGWGVRGGWGLRQRPHGTQQHRVSSSSNSIELNTA